MTIYCEVWCSPLRQETYSEKYISGETFDCPLIDEIKENYVSFGDFWYDVFGENYSEIGGLFKILCKIDVTWHRIYDWEGCPDDYADFEIEVLSKNKCSCLGELKSIWLELTGRSESYNQKLIDKFLKESD